MYKITSLAGTGSCVYLNPSSRHSSHSWQTGGRYCQSAVFLKAPTPTLCVFVVSLEGGALASQSAERHSPWPWGQLNSKEKGCPLAASLVISANAEAPLSKARGQHGSSWRQKLCLRPWALVWGDKRRVDAGMGRRICPFKESVVFPLQSNSWRSVQEKLQFEQL